MKFISAFACIVGSLNASNLFTTEPLVEAAAPTKVDGTIDLNSFELSGKWGQKVGVNKFRLPSDRLFWVKVLENPTTGYAWKVTENTCGITFVNVNSAFEPAASDLPGASGIRTFTF